jgi:hypothetical protein
MTAKVIAVAAFALPLIAAGSGWAGPPDGAPQQVSPPTWQQPEPERGAPYGLTGSEKPPVTRWQWRRDVQRLGRRVEIDRYRRVPADEEETR